MIDFKNDGQLDSEEVKLLYLIDCRSNNCLLSMESTLARRKYVLSLQGTTEIKMEESYILNSQ